MRSHHGRLAVNEIRLDDSRPWREKLLRTIQTNYGRAPCFEEVVPTLDHLIRLPTNQLADFNEAALRAFARRLGLEPAKMVRQSDLTAVGAATDLLVELTKAVGGTAYLAGNGAGGYQDDAAFETAGLDVIEQRFGSPPYPQRVEPFVPGLSIVDTLMSCGWDGTADLLLSRESRAEHFPRASDKADLSRRGASHSH